MQQIPSTPPLTFQRHPHHFKSSLSPLPPIKVNGNSIDHLKRQSSSQEDQSLKKRLQIFKQYKVKSAQASQNDDTVVYNKGRHGLDSGEGKEAFLLACQRQFQQCTQINRYGSGNHIGQQSGKRRQKIFSNLKSFSMSKYQLSFQSMQQSHQEPLITTQRLRNNIEHLLPPAQSSDPKLFSLFSAKTENMSTNNMHNVYSRTPSLQKLGIQSQIQPSLTLSNSSQKKQIQTNLLVSPSKITFTYHNPTRIDGIRQLIVPRASNFNLFGSETLNTAENKVESTLPRSFVERPAQPFKESNLNFRSSNEKKTFDFGDRSWNTRTNTTQGTKQQSWGNKIRTQLMGIKYGSDQKLLKYRELGHSKVSLTQLRQSLIINGEKIHRENLKINESLSNISDNKSSKRYYDEDIDFLPQVDKISYNNIDISREQSLQDLAQFKPNQLLLELQTHKYQSKSQQSLDILDISPVRKTPLKSRPKQEPILQKNLLLQLSQEPKSEQLTKTQGKTGKLFPGILVLLAMLLLVIQALV